MQWTIIGVTYKIKRLIIYGSRNLKLSGDQSSFFCCLLDCVSLLLCFFLISSSVYSLSFLLVHGYPDLPVHESTGRLKSLQIRGDGWIRMDLVSIYVKLGKCQSNSERAAPSSLKVVRFSQKDFGTGKIMHCWCSNCNRLRSEPLAAVNFSSKRILLRLIGTLLECGQASYIYFCHKTYLFLLYKDTKRMMLIESWIYHFWLSMTQKCSNSLFTGYFLKPVL